ncbi:hypothetical protein GCM10007923_29760 [Shinella yambaruensis]|uniref:Uncharacterized protein n=1 Tax=Shinella yambaruensis TaxID=415996 RepID=A0ABQ5ZJF7_9HYPH|nr:hypothetical protein GCM10007923_29760 [Shinella yambaruensis]
MTIGVDMTVDLLAGHRIEDDPARGFRTIVQPDHIAAAHTVNLFLPTPAGRLRTVAATAGSTASIESAWIAFAPSSG